LNNITRPEFVTLTGADDRTDLGRMRELSRAYPIEWGILFSPERRGGPRYPSLAFVSALRFVGFRLSAHVCGKYARDIIEHGHAFELESFIGSGIFQRVQINTSDPEVDPRKVGQWAQRLRLNAVLQCRNDDHFPVSTDVHWLFDRSGGNGLSPDKWPHTKDARRLVGYAGGIGPDNVSDVVQTIGAIEHSYWLDMETGVRDECDRMDMDACGRVCAQVFSHEEAVQ
jgi:hypothetical protein